MRSIQDLDNTDTHSVRNSDFIHASKERVYIFRWSVFKDWIRSSQNSQDEALILILFGYRSFKKFIRIKWSHSSRDLIHYDRCPHKKRTRHQGYMCTEKRPCEDTAREWTSASQWERPQRNPTLPAPWSWTSSPQKSEKIIFCCLSHPVCLWLWQLQQINTVRITLLWALTK